MGMLVRELKEELEARDQPKTGNKRHGCAGGCTAAPRTRDRARAASCRADCIELRIWGVMDTFTVL